MIVITQHSYGNFLDSILRAYPITGQTWIVDSLLAVWGQTEDDNIWPTAHIGMSREDLLVSGNVPTGGTFDYLFVDGRHLEQESGHTIDADFIWSGADIDFTDFWNAVMAGDRDLLHDVLLPTAVQYYGSAYDDEFEGSGFADRIAGGAGNDTLDGGMGDDALFGGRGADVLIGGDGFDFARYDDSDNYGNLVIDLSDPSQNTGAAAGDTYSGIEGIAAGYGNDALTGDANDNRLLALNGADTVRGGAGRDVIDGGSGNDQLYGDQDSDHLYGGLGADRLDGGAGLDYARYDDANYGNLVINLSNPGANTGAAAGDTFFGIECLVAGAGNDTVVGDAYSNRLFGMGGNDIVRAGVGIDYLDGGDGNDHLYGGAGADQIVGGEGLDYARYDEGNYGNLVIRLDAPGANTGAAAGDTYSGIENIVAGSGNDTIFGDGGINRLFGMGGGDLIDGRAGSDYLEGGAGVDVFRFSTALGATNVDTIADFQHGVDRIMLHSSIFAGIGPTLTANEFGPTSGAGRLIIYQQNTGRLFYDEGGAGVGAGPVQFALVTAGTILDVNDFVMV